MRNFQNSFATTALVILTFFKGIEASGCCCCSNQPTTTLNNLNTPTLSPPLPPTKLVYTFRRPDGSNFFLTSDENEARSIGIGFGPQRDGWIYTGAQFRVATSPLDMNWVPLYRYYNNVHHYTTDPYEIGATQAIGAVGKYGYRYEGIVGYVSKVQLPKTAPLHRFYLPGNNHCHQFVLDDNPDYWMNRANPRAIYENIAGYVFTNRAFDQ